MKIVVVGTSNSVVGASGFIETLRHDHEVVNISSGRAPFYKHVKTLTNNRALIEAADLLIIDHYVNDISFYYKNLGDRYVAQCEDFYALLSTINTRILNILFPIKGIMRYEDSVFYYGFIKDISRKYGIPLLDLNSFRFKPYQYMDRLHLKHDVSYLFGMLLSKELMTTDLGEKPSGGRLDGTPFRLVNVGDVVGAERLTHFENSLLSVDYLDLRDDLHVSAPAGSRLISLGYLNPKTAGSISACRVNGRLVGLSGNGYFHESLEFDVFGDVHLSPLLGEEAECVNLMGRGTARGRFDHCYLTELMFYDEGVETQYSSARRPPLDIRVSQLGEAADRLVKEEVYGMQQETFGFLRMAALSKEANDPQTSSDLLRLLLLINPNKPLLKTKLEEVRERLKETD